MIRVFKQKGTDNFHLTGDTYEHRNLLRRKDWIWNPASKTWSTRQSEPIEAVLDIITHIKPATSKQIFNALDLYIEARGYEEAEAKEEVEETAKVETQETPSIAVHQMWEGLLEKPAADEETQFIPIDKAQSGIAPTCWVTGIEIENMTELEGETSFGYAFNYKNKFGAKVVGMTISGFESPGAAKAEAFRNIESAFKTAASLGREAALERKKDGLHVPITDFSLKGLGY